MVKRLIFKMVILGDSGVGKTSLMNRFITQKFSSNYKATIGADFLTKEIEVDGVVVTMQIWDTAGQERYQSLGPAFYRGSDCCMLVYDVTSPKSYENIGIWKEYFVSNLTTIVDDKFPFVLIGNKVDVGCNRKVSKRRAEVYAASSNMDYVEASAKEFFGVNDAFEILAKKCLEIYKVKEEPFKHSYQIPDQIDLGSNEDSSVKKKCCP